MNQNHPEPATEPEPDFEETEEQLEELSERTAETMAEARKDVDRAMQTSHDQLLPSATQGDWEDEEGFPSKDDTRGAWPNWDESEEHKRRKGHEKRREPAEQAEGQQPNE